MKIITGVIMIIFVVGIAAYVQAQPNPPYFTFELHDSGTAPVREVTYHYPDQCPDMIAQIDKISERLWGTINVNYFVMALAFCVQESWLRKASPTAAQDYISYFDFDNVPISQLPVTNCDYGTHSRYYFEFCTMLRHERPNMNQALLDAYIMFTQESGWQLHEDNLQVRMEKAEAFKIDNASCRLASGYISYNLEASGDTVRCEPDERGEGMMIQANSLRFADVNRDGIMDALLLFTETGAGSSSRTGPVVLTRLSPDAPLTRIHKDSVLTEWRE